MTLFCYDNIAEAGNYTDVVGSSRSSGFNAATWWDNIRPTVVDVDAAGLWSVLLDCGVARTASTLILGAHAYELSGQRFAAGELQLESSVDNVTFIVQQPWVAITAATNEASIHAFAAVTARYWRLSLRNMTVALQYPIPELYLGNTVEIINPEAGIDVDGLVIKRTEKTGYSGRDYSPLHYQFRDWPSLRWSALTQAESVAMLAMRRNRVSNNKLWFQIDPIITPAPILVAVKGSINIKYMHANVSSMTMHLREYI